MKDDNKSITKAQHYRDNRPSLRVNQINTHNRYNLPEDFDLPSHYDSILIVLEKGTMSHVLVFSREVNNIWMSKELFWAKKPFWLDRTLFHASVVCRAVKRRINNRFQDREKNPDQKINENYAVTINTDLPLFRALENPVSRHRRIDIRGVEQMQMIRKSWRSIQKSCAIFSPIPFSIAANINFYQLVDDEIEAWRQKKKK